MNGTDKITNSFAAYSFVVLSVLILIFGAVFAIRLIGLVADIVSSGSTSHSVITIVSGILCIALMPVCFRVLRSLRILELSDTPSGNRKLIVHPALFVNDITLSGGNRTESNHRGFSKHDP